MCDPQTKKGGDAEKGPLATPKRKTSEEKEKKKPIRLSKKMKIRRTKICMLKLKTNEKVGDETFPPGTHERHGANFPNKRRPLGNRYGKDQSKPENWAKREETGNSQENTNG